jgi:two-component system cell cycle sensor histidine kinase/response regulator CckA
MVSRGKNGAWREMVGSLRTAVEQAAESVVVTDARGVIVYVNPAFERITGYRSDEVVGQTPLILKSGAQDAAFYENLWATLTAGRVWQGRFVNRRKDGSLYTEEATICPVRDARGVVVNYAAVKRDVTRELLLEEQYYRAQKMEAVGRLTAGIAHDFNNILTAIDGFAELVSLALAPNDPLQESIRMVLNSGHHAESLIGQLLAFSRKQAARPATLKLNEVVAAVDKMLRRVIGEDITLQVTLLPGLWPIRADMSQVEQVILNLAVNARDAMPRGGRLTIETANVTLDGQYAGRRLDLQAGEYVLLMVGDTGIGMSEEVKARIFEPFFTTKEDQGTGLGLATVYGIVRQCGGDVRVHSQEGVGTTFEVYLPRVEQHTAPRPVVPQERQGMPAGSETILVVEDDPVVRTLIRRVLHNLGYTLLEAGDGQTALRLAGDFPGAIHLLLTDSVMPGMSGQTLAEQLAPSRPGLSVLFMSGYTDDVILHHGYLAMGVSFLQKPFSVTDLARKVRAVLDKADSSWM